GAARARRVCARGKDQGGPPGPAAGGRRRFHVGRVIGDDVKLAMVFPGQGSQWVGMLKAYAGLPGTEELRHEVQEILGQDFLKLLDDGPAGQLNLTTNTQPAMVAAAISAYRAWQVLGGPAPAVVAGHSLGEYAALVAS